MPFKSTTWNTFISPFSNSFTNTFFGLSHIPHLLKQYPGAAAAFSLQNIGGDGNVIRARRSSDDAENNFSAADITGGALATFAGAGNAFVTTWYDQSGNGQNATQSTAAAQPKIVNSGSVITDSNGNAAMSFDGSNDKLGISGEPLITASNSGAWSGFSVHEIGTADVGFVYGNTAGGGAGTALRAIAGPQFTVSNATTTADFIARSTSNVPDLLSTCYNNGDAQLRLNQGGTPTSGSYSFSAGTLDFTIGDWPNSPITNSSLSGLIGEIIIYNSDQSANRSAIESNIMGRYGI